MVEYSLQLDSVFSSLADPTRRDILRRVSQQELSVGTIAKSYTLTFAAISKHLKVLEKANLIQKHKRGKEHMIQLVPQTFADADAYLRLYRELWETRFDALEQYLKEG